MIDKKSRPKSLKLTTKKWDKTAYFSILFFRVPWSSDLPLGCDVFERNYSDSWTWGRHLQQQELALTNPALPLRRGCNASRFDCLVWFGGGMQFGMHICLSVEQTHRNPFTCNSAKLACGQALHLKCTISYPCLLSMQHFWDINHEGNPRRMAVATPYTLPPCCLFSVLVFFFFLPCFHSCISWGKLESVSCHLGGCVSICVFLWSLYCVLAGA